MAYKKFSRRSKKRYPKSTRKAIRREVKSVLSKQVEIKSQFLNNSSTPDDIPSDGSFLVDFTDTITTGTAPFGRIGDLIHLKSFTADVRVLASTGGFIVGADAYNYVRCIVFRYNDDGVPANPLGEIFDVPPSPEPIHNPFLYRNVDYMSQYNVIYDKRVRLFPHLSYTGTNGPNTVTYNVTGAGANAHFKIRLSGKKLGAKNVRYSSAGSGASTTHGGIFMMLVSDSSSSPHPQVFYNARVSYTDS